jgi:hypothetical protein
LHSRFSLPRFACPQYLSDAANRLADKSRPTARYLAEGPKKLALGAAVATVAAAGLTTAVATAGPAPMTGAAGSPGAASYSGAVHAANHKPHHAHLATHHGADQQAHSQQPAAIKHAPAKHAPAPKHVARHRTASHHAAVHYAAVHHAVAHRLSHAHSVLPTKPYLIYDSTTPSAIPAHRNAAAYATGNYAASAAQMTGRHRVLWIDTTGYDPHASVLDVEPGDATPAVAANWAKNRLAADPHAVARLYTFRNEWPAVQSAVASLPHQMQSRIRWWIADPTGVPHIVPGSSATQWYWGSSYDITTAAPRF